MRFGRRGHGPYDTQARHAPVSTILDVGANARTVPISGTSRHRPFFRTGAMSYTVPSLRTPRCGSSAMPGPAWTRYPGASLPGIAPTRTSGPLALRYPNGVRPDARSFTEGTIPHQP